MSDTRILSIDSAQAFPTAISIIQHGCLIAFPTDTIYGLAADPLNPDAIRQIFTAKERPEEKALPGLIADLDQ